MTFKLSKPSPGGNWSKEDHLDHLMLFIGDFERREQSGANGAYTAVHVDYIVCCDCPHAWIDQLVSGAALVPRLSDVDGEIVVGRLGQGLAKPGKSAPWTLDDPTEGDMGKAQTTLESYATHLPTGSITVDVKAINAPQSVDPPF